ncbi:MAG TPA: HAD family phosphatase [Bryobacteraceae bacterium]|nr:HAD family phosphatase [Bryobacteraceae bacterium]
MTGAVLWDMDGTLVDSEEYHWLSWRDTMSQESIPVSHAQFLETFGQRNDAILPRWLGTTATAEQIQRIGDAKEALYRKLVREGGLRPLPGAKEWVERLHREGWRQAIASSAPRANVEAVLEVMGMAGDFEAIVSAEDVTAGKPDPQVFLKAAERLATPPARCIVVEDAAAGVEAARRAGMRSIGVSRNGAPLPADLAVRSLADLPNDAFRLDD